MVTSPVPASHPEALRAPLPAVRVLLTAFCLLTVAGFVSLAVLSDRTSETFAWTIAPPLTAAFLGSGYGAGFVLSLMTLLSRVWVDVRVPYVTVLVFTWVTALATFLHRDRLHLATPGSGPVAEPAAWVWVVVYVVVPVAMAVLLPLQERSPGRDPAPGAPLPVWLRGLLVVQAVVLLALGVVLLVDPERSASLWPWSLTPFTARVVAAWLLAFGVAAALALRVGDLARLRVATLTWTVLGVLQVLALARWAGDVAWDRPAAPAYLVALAVVLVTGVAGLRLSIRAAARRDAPLTAPTTRRTHGT